MQIVMAKPTKIQQAHQTTGLLFRDRGGCQGQASMSVRDDKSLQRFCGDDVRPTFELVFRRLLPHGGLKNRLKLPKTVELNLAAVEREIAFEDNVHRGAPRKLSIGSAGKQNGSETGCRTDSGANASTLWSAGGDGAYPRSCGRCGYHRPRLLALVAAAGDFAFRIHGLIAAGIRAARRCPQIDRVAVWQNQGIDAHAKFATALDSAGALGFQQFAAKIGPNRHYNAVVLGNRKGGLKIHGVAGFGAARGDAVLEHDADSRSRGNSDFFAGAGRLFLRRLDRKSTRLNS